LGYLGIKQKPVYLNMLDDATTDSEIETPSKEKYLRNKLDDKIKEEYKIRLLDFIEKEKPYLQAKLTINDLSDALQIPKHFISQIINDSLGHTFYSLINSYRVNEVKQRMLSNDKDKFTLLAIAFDSGFNSKSGFNTNFKLETGMTPMEYKRRIQSSSL
jgi:AraC-like DNA-binding protein